MISVTQLKETIPALSTSVYATTDANVVKAHLLSLCFKEANRRLSSELASPRNCIKSTQVTTIAIPRQPRNEIVSPRARKAAIGTKAGADRAIG